MFTEEEKEESGRVEVEEDDDDEGERPWGKMQPRESCGQLRRAGKNFRNT